MLAGRTVADTTAGTAHDNQRGLELHSHVFGLRSQTSEIPVNSGEPTMIHERWQKGWELEHPGGHLEDHDASGNTSSVASSTAGGHKRGLEGKTFQEGSESQVADVSHILKGVDPDDPCKLPSAVVRLLNQFPVSPVRVSLWHPRIGVVKLPNS